MPNLTKLELKYEKIIRHFSKEMTVTVHNSNTFKIDDLHFLDYKANKMCKYYIPREAFK